MIISLSKAINEKKEYILPARFDDTEIPGIQSTISYIDLSDKTPIEFSKIILKKLGINTKEKFDTGLSEITLNVNHCVLISMNPIDKTTSKSSYITIKVENHGIYPVFFKYPLIKVKNSTDSFHIFYDDLFNKPVNIGKLEAGDSHEINVNPIKYNDSLDLWDFVEITDKIGRTIKTTSEELYEAMASWESHK